MSRSPRESTGKNVTVPRRLPRRIPVRSRLGRLGPFLRQPVPHKHPLPRSTARWPHARTLIMIFCRCAFWRSPTQHAHEEVLAWKWDRKRDQSCTADARHRQGPAPDLLLPPHAHAVTWSCTQSCDCRLAPAWERRDHKTHTDQLARGELDQGNHVLTPGERTAKKQTTKREPWTESVARAQPLCVRGCATDTGNARRRGGARVRHTGLARSAFERR